MYGLFTDVPGDYVKKPMKECTGKEITQEWLYHIGVPVEQIPDLAAHSAVCVPTMMPYITAFFMPRTRGDRPDVIPDGCVNFAFLGQFADTPRAVSYTHLDVYKRQEQGYPRAQFSLGWCLEHGKGVSRDRKEAAKWYQAAAKQDYPEAQEALKAMERREHHPGGLLWDIWNELRGH